MTPLHPLSPRRFLPEGARCKRDRGPGLYLADAFVDSPYFACEPLARGWRLHPAPALLKRLESEAGEPRGALSRSLIRFRGLSAEAEAIDLFSEGAKLLEAPEAGRQAAWERALRQRAAACLRLRGAAQGRAEPPPGGGLYACAILAEALCRGAV